MEGLSLVDMANVVGRLASQVGSMANSMFGVSTWSNSGLKVPLSGDPATENPLSVETVYFRETEVT